MDAGSEHRTAPGVRVVYREPLRVPWWWYLIGLCVAGVFAAEFHVGNVGLIDWLAFGILLPLSIIVCWSLGRGVLQVTSGADGQVSSGELHVRGAHLPLREISGVVALDTSTLRRVVGREGDPEAFVQIRPWIGPGVQLWLDDPDDPTPYWVISTRNPRAITDLLRANIQQ